jgi:hypothetical protein
MAPKPQANPEFPFNCDSISRNQMSRGIFQGGDEIRLKVAHSWVSRSTELLADAGCGEGGFSDMRFFFNELR